MIWLLLGVVLLFGFTAFFGAPYLPSKKSEVERAFAELYPLGSGDTLVDIGSGDGLVLRVAASKGARAVGYEINPLLVLVARFLSRGNPLVEVRLQSYWGATFPAETTVIYTFGDSRDIAKMANKAREAASVSGRKIVLISYAVTVPGLEPLKSNGTHHLYEMRPLQ